MAKVAVKKAASKSEGKTTVLADVKGYARKIYLAGLGAYAKAGKESVDYLKDLVKAGESVRFAFDAKDCHLFNADGTALMRAAIRQD